MAKEKEITTFNVQVAEFIRNHKKNGTAVDDEVTEKLVIPFSLDADQIDDLLERLTDGGISITAVSYTHLDVYKRQVLRLSVICQSTFLLIA